MGKDAKPSERDLPLIHAMHFSLGELARRIAEDKQAVQAWGCRALRDAKAMAEAAGLPLTPPWGEVERNPKRFVGWFTDFRLTFCRRAGVELAERDTLTLIDAVRLVQQADVPQPTPAGGPPPWPNDDDWRSGSEIARIGAAREGIGFNAAKARLTRWRYKTPQTPATWLMVEDRRPRDDKYRYRIGAVRGLWT